MSTYVISDIHGNYEAFKKMLKMINLQNDDTLFVLGDMIDRGEQNLQVVKHVMNSPNMKAIVGNHEEMLMEALRTYGYSDPWAAQMLQGTDTYKTYRQLKKLRKTSPYEAMQIVKYLKSLPTHYTIQISDTIFHLVHAGIRSSNLVENTREDMLWIREEFYRNDEKYPFTVVFGHTPTLYLGEKGRIWRKEDRIGIDCGASFMGGRLACLRLDDFTEYYV